mmetsp:Transcript_117902/g.313676  ORF Transcript_117902/g.313676 Transcript_117902/m.313676 type:complete len:297 (+) Transcript_117902:143-1033(+)
MVKTSPVVSMRAPVFSWTSLILEPFGPMTMPIFASGTFTVAVDLLPSFSFSAARAAAAAAAAAATAAAATCSGVAPTAWDTSGVAAAAFTSAAVGMPGMCCCGWPGLTPVALASIFSRSSRSLRFCCFLVRPVETSHSGPVPSSSCTNLSGLASRLLGSSSSCGFAAALEVALGFAACFALPSALAAGFATALAGALASPPVCAFGSAFGSALGCATGSGLAVAFALGAAAAGAGGSALALAFTAFGCSAGAGASFSGAAFSFALFAAALRLALLEGPWACSSTILSRIRPCTASG